MTDRRRCCAAPDAGRPKITTTASSQQRGHINLLCATVASHSPRAICRRKIPSRRARQLTSCRSGGGHSSGAVDHRAMWAARAAALSDQGSAFGTKGTGPRGPGFGSVANAYLLVCFLVQGRYIASVVAASLRRNTMTSGRCDPVSTRFMLLSGTCHRPVPDQTAARPPGSPVRGMAPLARHVPYAPVRPPCSRATTTGRSLRNLVKSERCVRGDETSAAYKAGRRPELWRGATSLAKNIGLDYSRSGQRLAGRCFFPRPQRADLHGPATCLSKHSTLVW